MKLPKFILLGFSLALFIAGCGVAPEQSRGRILLDETTPLNFGVFPFLEEATLRAALFPLVEYLSRHLNRRIELRIVSDYADLEKLVQQERVDLGWFTPRSPRQKEKTGLTPICRPRSDTIGYYHGIIIARSDTGIASLADLRGKWFAYVDRGSNSGFLYPNRLLAMQGIDPLTFFGRTYFAGTHDRALEGVLNGTYQAAGVSELVLRRINASAPIVVLATTSPILPDPIVVSNRLDSALASLVRDLLIHPEAHEGGLNCVGSLSQSLGFTGFSDIPSGPAQ